MTDFEISTSIQGEWDSLMFRMQREKKERAALRKFASKITKVPDTVRRYT